MRKKIKSRLGYVIIIYGGAIMDYYNDENLPDNNFRFTPPPQFSGGVSEAEFYRFKKKLTVIVAIVLTLLVIANVVFWVVMREQLSDDIVSEIVSESGNSVVTSVKENLTEEVLSQYKRQYSLPEEGGVGLQCASDAVNSVVVINCSYTVQTGWPARSSTTSGSASGIIVSADGYILTNANVVFYNRSSRTLYDTIECVVSTSGTDHNYTMSVVAYDIDMDLALCKITDTLNDTLQPATFSTIYNLGEEVAVIGNAKNYGISITTGVLSQLPKSYASYSGFDITSDLIQTDAAVNPGNSGGCMCNIYGECLGVVCAKIADTDVEGIGFAISTDSVIEFLESKRPSLQLSIAD